MRVTFFLLLASIGCSESVGRSDEAVDYVCGESASATLDGIPAYAFCGNFDVWTNNGADTKDASGGAGWIRTETNYGYQCAEYALRYSHFAFGVTTVWTGISYADQMCATHPATMSVTNTPVHGDLMVFAGGTCGTTNPGGHVAVVDSVGASTVDVVQENPAGAVTWTKACASCFLHADHNHGVSDPCESSSADGVYCGQTIKMPGGAKDVLYTCAGGLTTSSTTCAAGCVVNACAIVDDGGGADASVDAASDAGDISDAAGGPEASPDAGGVAPPPPESSGCAVGLGSSPASGFAVAIAALVLLAIRRRA